MQDATNFYNSSILNYTSLGATHSLPIAHTYYSLATLLIKNNKQFEAHGCLKQAQQALRSLSSPEPLLSSQVSFTLATLLYREGDYRLAGQEAARALLFFEGY